MMHYSLTAGVSLQRSCSGAAEETGWLVPSGTAAADRLIRRRPTDGRSLQCYWWLLRWPTEMVSLASHFVPRDLH